MKIWYLLILCIFVSIVAYLIISESTYKKKLHKQRISGRVISVEKKLKDYYEIMVIQSEKIMYIGFIPRQKDLLVGSGDSVFKESNSEFFYLKKQENSTFSQVDWIDIHISRE